RPSFRSPERTLKNPQSCRYSEEMCVIPLSSPSDVATPEPPQLRSRRRDEIPDRFQWNAADIFETWEAWEAGYKELEAGIARYAELKGSLSGGAEALLRA